MKNSLHLLFRNKISGKTDPKIYNVIKNEVTLNPFFKFKHYFLDDSSTIFIGGLPVYFIYQRKSISPEILNAASKPRNISMSETKFFDGLVETLKCFIEEKWSRDKHHLIQHSSGWDSRIMSSIIRQIYEERGDCWLGDASFVAWGHETDLAAKIIEIEGWNVSLFTPLPKDEHYFNYGLDFSYAWRGLNGVAGYPINNPDWAFNMLRKRGIIPEDPERTQVWAASWFNEMFNAIMCPEPFEERFIKFYYYCTNAQYGAAFDFEFVQPLFNPRSIKHLVETQIHLRGTSSEIRERLMNHLDKKLIRFPRLDPQIVKVPQRFFERAKQDYSNSWYGKTHPLVPRKTTRDIRYASWWADWSTASLCEHLVEEDVKVKT